LPEAGNRPGGGAATSAGDPAALERARRGSARPGTGDEEGNEVRSQPVEERDEPAGLASAAAGWLQMARG